MQNLKMHPIFKQFENLNPDICLLPAGVGRNIIDGKLLSEHEIDELVRTLPDAPGWIWQGPSEGLNFMCLENLARISKKTNKKQILHTGCPPLEKNFKIWQDVEKKYNWQDANLGIIFTCFLFDMFKEKIIPIYLDENVFDSYNNNFTKRFLFLNHNDKLERAKVLGLLSYRKLLDNFYFSYCNENPYHWTHPNDPEGKCSLSEQQMQGLKYLQFPQRLDNDQEWFENPNYDPMLDLQPSIQPFYKNSAIGVVSETNFWTSGHLKFPEQIRELTHIAFLDHAYFTEKTIKYICAKRPFIQMNIAGCLDDFRELGFKSFAPYIDETYDTIKSESKRIIAIVNEIERLCSLSEKEFRNIVEGCGEIAQYNYNHLKNFAKTPVGYNLD